MLTNDDLEKFSSDGKLAGDCEVEAMARELLAIREAGDEAVEQHFANLRLVFGNTDSMAQSLAADSIHALRKIVSERKELRQQLREARAENNRYHDEAEVADALVLSLQEEVKTLTAERDAAIQNYDRFLTEWFEDSTDYDRLVDVAESHVDPEGWLSTECRRIHDVFLKRFEEKMNDDE